MPVSIDFLKVCKACDTFCCKQRLPPISIKEKEEILNMGNENYFIPLKDDIYTIKALENGSCPYLKSDNTCHIHNVKPDLCKIWPIVPRIKNNKKEYIVIKCPIFPLLSEDDIKNSKKEAEKIPSEIINQLWNISNELKEKYKKFEYEVI